MLPAGCVSPEKRIQQNPGAFARCTPQQQALIKQGKVDIGFDEEMVKLALGEPDKVYERTDAKGKSESWVYTLYEGRDGGVFYRGFYHRSFCDPDLFPYYLDHTERQEAERFRLVLRNGKVESIEQLTK
jgi:hypothetical protein